MIINGLMIKFYLQPKLFQIRMAGNPETVSKFLTGLAEKLQPLWGEEKAEMLKLKEDEVSLLVNCTY
jgi:Zn-dependent oligopeptidase